MCEVIILRFEIADSSGKEPWYSDNYVAKQIERLEAGERFSFVSKEKDSDRFPKRVVALCRRLDCIAL